MRHRRQRQRQRLIRSFTLGGLLIVAAGLVAVIVARVTLLSAALDAMLAAQGFRDARYRVASVDLDSTRIVDIQLGAELAAAELVLRYHPLHLLRLEVEDLAIAGLRLDLTAMGNGAASGPLARLLTQDQTRDESPPVRLPRLGIADGTVRLPGDLRVSLRDLAWQPAADGVESSLTIGHLDGLRAEQRIAADHVTAEIRPGSKVLVRFTAAALRHDVADPLVAQLSLAGSVTRSETDWRLAATARGPHAAQLILTASYDGETAVGRVSLPTTRFAPGALQPGDILRPLDAMKSVAGTIAGHLAVDWRSGQAVVPSGALRIDGLSFEARGVPRRVARAGEGECRRPTGGADRRGAGDDRGR